MNKAFNISSHEFSLDAEKFLATIPEEGDVAGVTPTLLLFHSQIGKFFWCLLNGKTVEQEVERAMSIDRLQDSPNGPLLPLGVVRLFPKRRPDGRVSFEAKWWIHPAFKEEEVAILNGTVPYFLAQAFPDSYKLAPDGKPADQNVHFYWLQS
jgi:hypothetical protein